MENANQANRQLHDALELLENCLETPVVPGELESWVQRLDEAWTESVHHLREQIQQRHQDQLDQIEQEDTELLTQVEQMRAEDQQILSAMQELGGQVDRLRQRALRIEPHEQRADTAVKALREGGIAWIVRVRTQEAAISTWFVEAFNRDRGTVD